jgi:TolB-like protein
VTRHNRRNRAEEALENLLSRFDASEPVIRHAASALLMLEPSHEGAARCLMRHHASNQNGAAARRVYDKLANTLRQDYQLEPSAETTALATSLSDPTLPHQREKPSPGRAPVVAVCAFANASDAVAAFAAGFRSELIINLSKFRELTIIDMQDVRSTGDADYQLKTDCGEHGEQLTLVVSLEESTASRVVWSDSYGLTLANWHATQRQLVGRIASKLEIYLSQDRLARALQRLPEDLGVYDAWLRGEHLLLRWSAEAEDEAERLFEQAIAEDATFAPAHASLASVYNSRHLIRPGRPRDAHTQRRALALARRAVELDPLDARNHMVVAWSAAMAQRFEQAELHFDLAAELNQHDPKIIVSAALGLAFMGRIDLATRLSAHVLELTPLFPDYQWSHMATTRFFAGDYLGAIEAAERSQNVIIDTPGWKAAALGKLGRIEEQQAALAELLRAAEAAWAGSGTPSREDIITWFLDAFPIRRISDRQNLAAALGQ